MIALARRASTPLAVLVIAVAVAWWWWTFGEVIGYGYLSWREAGHCLLSDNDICALAKTLCLGAHPRLFFAYRTVAFWVGSTLLSVSLLASPGRQASA